MKDEVELVIRPDGVIESIYQDGLEKFAKEVGGEVAKVCRASNVEWEDNAEGKGWTVRAAHDPSLALRFDPPTRWPAPPLWSPSREGGIVHFGSREMAIREEIKFFWKLLEKEK